jgi:hypothetical protein
MSKGKGEGDMRNNKRHEQKCHQNSIKQHRHTSEEHRGAPPWNGQQHKYCCGV